MWNLLEKTVCECSFRPGKSLTTISLVRTQEKPKRSQEALALIRAMDSIDPHRVFTDVARLVFGKSPSWKEAL